MVSTTDKAVADKVDSEATEGADFTSSCKDDSLEVTSKTVNSASQGFPADVLTAAFKQDANAVSDVVTVSNSLNLVLKLTTRHKTVSKSEKCDWKTMMIWLRSFTTGKKSDTNFNNSVIASPKKYNVKVVGKALAQILPVCDWFWSQCSHWSLSNKSQDSWQCYYQFDQDLKYR